MWRCGTILIERTPSVRSVLLKSIMRPLRFSYFVCNTQMKMEPTPIEEISNCQRIGVISLQTTKPQPMMISFRTNRAKQHVKEYKKMTDHYFEIYFKAFWKVQCRTANTIYWRYIILVIGCLQNELWLPACTYKSKWRPWNSPRLSQVPWLGSYWSDHGVRMSPTSPFVMLTVQQWVI